MRQRVVFLAVIFSLSAFSCFAQKYQERYKGWCKVTTTDFTFYIPRNLQEATSIHEPRKAIMKLYIAPDLSSWFAVSLYKEFPVETKKYLGITEESIPSKMVETKSVKLKGAEKAFRSLKENKLKSDEPSYSYELKILKNEKDEAIFLSVHFKDVKMKQIAEQILASITIN